MKLQKDNNGRYSITIPRAIAESQDWSKGDNFQFKIVSNDVLKLINLEEVEE